MAKSPSFGILRRLFPYMRPYRRQALFACLFMLGEVILDLLQPLFMKYIVNQGVLAGNMSAIWSYGGIMVGLTLLGVGCGLGCLFFSSRAGTSFSADLRQDTFYKVQELSFAGIDTFGVPSLITRLTVDVAQVQAIAMQAMRTFVRAPFLAIGGIVIAILISPSLSAVLLVALPALAIAVALVFKKAVPRFFTVQTRLDEMSAVMRENLSGMRVVKVFARQPHERQRFDASNRAYTDASLRASSLMIVVNPILMMVVNMSILAMLYISGGLSQAGQVESGDVIAFINYLMQILSALMMVGFLFINLSRAKVSAQRVVEILDQPVDIHSPENGYAPRQGGAVAVAFSRVTFRYPGAAGQPVLADVSVHVPPGSMLAILGGTGSGKSTLLSLVGRYYDVAEAGGSVSVDGVDVRRWDLQALRGSCAMVLQHAALFSGSIRDNLLWGNPDATQTQLERACAIAQIHDFVKDLPHGYDTLLGQKGINLSGGQKQRLCIARALLMDAPLLILDDATSAVDAATEAAIHANLRQSCPTTTVLLVVQRVSSTRTADAILVLEDGQVAGLGRHQELLTQCAVYRDICQSQGI